jgi:hypothetical protein
MGEKNSFEENKSLTSSASFNGAFNIVALNQSRPATTKESE